MRPVASLPARLSGLRRQERQPNPAGCDLRTLIALRSQHLVRLRPSSRTPLPRAAQPISHAMRPPMAARIPAASRLGPVRRRRILRLAGRRGPLVCLSRLGCLALLVRLGRLRHRGSLSHLVLLVRLGRLNRRDPHSPQGRLRAALRGLALSDWRNRSRRHQRKPPRARSLQAAAPCPPSAHRLKMLANPQPSRNKPSKQPSGETLRLRGRRGTRRLRVLLFRGPASRFRRLLGACGHRLAPRKDLQATRHQRRHAPRVARVAQAVLVVPQLTEPLAHAAARRPLGPRPLGLDRLLLVPAVVRERVADLAVRIGDRLAVRAVAAASAKSSDPWTCRRTRRVTPRFPRVWS